MSNTYNIIGTPNADGTLKEFGNTSPKVESPAAVNVSFDNTGTDLESTNAEDAIKEVQGEVEELSSNLVVETGTTNISGITYTKMGRLVTIHVINAPAAESVTIITGLPEPYGSAYISSNLCNTPIGANGEVIGRIEYSKYGSTHNWHYYCHETAGYTSLSYISS